MVLGSDQTDLHAHCSGGARHGRTARERRVAPGPQTLKHPCCRGGSMDWHALVAPSSPRLLVGRQPRVCAGVRLRHRAQRGGRGRGCSGETASSTEVTPRVTCMHRRRAGRHPGVPEPRAAGRGRCRQTQRRLRDGHGCILFSSMSKHSERL